MKSAQLNDNPIVGLVTVQFPEDRTLQHSGKSFALSVEPSSTVPDGAGISAWFQGSTTVNPLETSVRGRTMWDFKGTITLTGKVNRKVPYNETAAGRSTTRV